MYIIYIYNKIHHETFKIQLYFDFCKPYIYILYIYMYVIYMCLYVYKEGKLVCCYNSSCKSQEMHTQNWKGVFSTFSKDLIDDRKQ